MRSRLLLSLASVLLVTSSACAQRATTSAATSTAPIAAAQPPPAEPMAAEPPPAEPARAEPPLAEPPPAEPPLVETPLVFTIASVDGLPDDLASAQPVVEWARGAVDGEPTFGTRVFADGSVFRYSAVDGKLAWRLVGEMSESGLAELDRQIRDVVDRGIFAPPGTAEVNAYLDATQPTMTYRAWVDGREYISVQPYDRTEKMKAMTLVEAAVRRGTVKK